MPLVCFNVDKFKCEEVDCSPDARHRADFIYKLNNLQKMELSNEEIAASIRRDHFIALCVKNRTETKTPRPDFKRRKIPSHA